MAVSPALDAGQWLIALPILVQAAYLSRVARMRMLPEAVREILRVHAISAAISASGELKTLARNHDRTVCDTPPACAPVAAAQSLRPVARAMLTGCPEDSLQAMMRHQCCRLPSNIEAPPLCHRYLYGSDRQRSTDLRSTQTVPEVEPAKTKYLGWCRDRAGAGRGARELLQIRV